MKNNILLDCDPGHDDALAIFLTGKSPKLNLLGLSVSAGNQTLEKTALNAFHLCRFLNINVPICPGSPVPLVQKSMTCPAIHGESGLDGFCFPDEKPTYDKRSGAQLIIDTVMNNDNVSVIVTGPMTNLALAIRMEPRIIKRLKQVIFMGGSLDYGNVSPAAEFNILVDPEAAHIVINSGIKIKMIGLNITRQVLITDKVIERLKTINTKAGKMFYKLLKVFLVNQQKTFGLTGAPLHDPVTVASLLDEDLVTFKKMHVSIDLSHNESYGRTNVDVYDYLKLPHNVEVGVNIDTTRFWNMVYRALEENI